MFPRLQAACGLALYYDTGSLREYSIFAVGAAATALWFVRHNFVFLDILVGTTHLHTLCGMLLVALVPAVLLPGLVAARAPKLAVGALLMLQVRAAGRAGGGGRQQATGRVCHWYGKRTPLVTLEEL